jgi:hypothetical protein
MDVRVGGRGRTTGIVERERRSDSARGWDVRGSVPWAAR